MTLVMNVTYARTDVTSRRNAICPTSAFGRRGHRNAFTLRKHACSNTLRIFPLNNKNFQMKNYGSLHISAQNIDYGHLLEPPRRGGSNGYSQSMFLSRNKKNNLYPCERQFYYTKWGLKGSELCRRVFVMRIPE